jgi:hypothetical protein
LGARPGSASGCFKKATQIPKAGHPIFDQYGQGVYIIRWDFNDFFMFHVFFFTENVLYEGGQGVAVAKLQKSSQK